MKRTPENPTPDVYNYSSIIRDDDDDGDGHDSNDDE